jgi:two-component system cell cycle response regulator
MRAIVDLAAGDVSQSRPLQVDIPASVPNKDLQIRLVDDHDMVHVGSTASTPSGHIREFTMLAQTTAIEELDNGNSGYLVPRHHLETWSPPCRVMVVDDDALTRKCLQGLLQREAYDVVVACSGDEAMGLMRTTPCDIVLTDWQMPDMDGIALCRILRRTYQPDDVYVLLLTVRQAEQDRCEALAAGADDYVVKGAPLRDVLDHLNSRRIARARQLSGSDDQEAGLSTTDPLTGTHNQRFFIEQLPREIERAQYSRHALAVLSCCIDAFEHAVSYYGHDAADEALRAFVTATNKCLQNGEGWLARVGENQFMIVLRETRLQGAERLARILRQACRSAPVRTRLGPMCFTVSIAVTAFEGKHS